jgi:hypothetical protein
MARAGGDALSAAGQVLVMRNKKCTPLDPAMFGKDCTARRFWAVCSSNAGCRLKASYRSPTGRGRPFAQAGGREDMHA